MRLLDPLILLEIFVFVASAAQAFEYAAAQEAFTTASVSISTRLNKLHRTASICGPVVATHGKQMVMEQIPKAASAVAVWVRENPAIAAGAVIGTTGIVVVASPTLISLPVLSAVGFGEGVIGPATLASGIQSGIGNVVAGSWFATMQSAAAGGAGATIVNGGIQASGAIMATAGGGLVWAKSKL